MTEVRFYHLVRKRLEHALPELLAKCFERGWRVVVMAGSADRAEALTQHLWTYNDRSFLPHGNTRDGEAADQPIWLTDTDENPNAATVLFLTDGARSDHVGRYDLVCELFDGADADAVQAARGRWMAYRDAGHVLAYWQQGEDGRWREQQRSPAGDGENGPQSAMT